MNKYLFLDIDGVLNHDEWFDSVHYKRHQENWKKSMFDPECVARVNRILEETGARLVVSSSWRSMTDLEEIFAGVALPTKFDRTPHADQLYPKEDPNDKYLNPIGSEWSGWDDLDIRYWRGSEIKYYLDRHPAGNYAILDDDTDMLDEQLEHFIQTCGDKINTPNLYINNEGSGLTDKVMNKAIDILNGNAKTTDN
jgi:hypothetical protein